MKRPSNNVTSRPARIHYPPDSSRETVKAATSEANARIAQLEAALAEKGAALAAAHEALKLARAQISLALADQMPTTLREHLYSLLHPLDTALAPTLRRAATLDRLRRVVCQAALAMEYEAERTPAERPYRTNFLNALAALRAEEEKG